MTTPPAPHAVIIGAMKCATTTLHHLLAAHPRLATSPFKELDYFSHDEQFARGDAWYRDQFDGPAGALVLDSSPNYTKRQHWPHTAARLAAANPAARLVYLVREPVDRARSAYLHELAAGREHRDIETVLSDPSSHITATSRYAWQLEPFLECFEADQVLVMRFDEVVSAPVDTRSRALAHLGLDDLDTDPEPVPTNPSEIKTMPTALVRALRHPRARGALRRIHHALAERPLPEVDVPPRLEARIRAQLLPELEALQATGLVDVADWIELART